MQNTKRSFIADASLIFSRNVSVLVISFITSIILARYLGPEGQGIIASVLVYPVLLTGLAELGIGQATIYLIGRKEDSYSDIIRALLWYLVVSSIVSTVIVAGIFVYLKDPDFSILLIILALFYIPLRLTIVYSQCVFLGREEIQRYNRLAWIPPIIVFVGTIILVIFLRLQVIGAMLATVAGSICAVYYAIRLLSEYSPLIISFNADLIKKMFSYGIIYALSTFLLQINYKVDIVIMQQLSTAAEIGQYVVGVSIADLIWMIPSAVTFLIFSRSANAKNPELFTKSMIKLFRVTFLLAIVCGAGFIFFVPYVIPLVYGNAFYPSITVIKLIIPGVVLMTAFKVLNSDLAGKGKPIISFLAFIPAAIINIILNIIWIPIYGANGAALASTVSYCLGSVLFVYLYSKELKISIREIFSYSTRDFDFIRPYLKKLTNLRN